MNHDEYCARVEAEVTRMADVVTGADPAAPVAGCPDWDLAKLVRHTGIVHRWAAAIVATRASERIPQNELDIGLPADPAGYPQWLARGSAPLVTALREAGPDTAVWAWGNDHRSGWWARRMLHETTVHRADAERTLGLEPVIDPVAAADGVDEFLLVAPLGSRVSKRLAELPAGHAIHLHATDSVFPGIAPASGEWLISLDGGGYTWSHGHAKGTVAVRGPAALLLLFAYGRIRPDDARLTVFGDATLLQAWQDIMTLLSDEHGNALHGVAAVAEAIPVRLPGLGAASEIGCPRPQRCLAWAVDPCLQLPPLPAVPSPLANQAGVMPGATTDAHLDFIDGRRA
jgi:uncharacterized protein (TIGR03083 family)